MHFCNLCNITQAVKQALTVSVKLGYNLFAVRVNMFTDAAANSFLKAGILLDCERGDLSVQ